jgi:hypothetical protein
MLRFVRLDAGTMERGTVERLIAALKDYNG